MVNYNVCACMLAAIIVAIILFALLMMPGIRKRMFAGNIDSDTAKVVKATAGPPRQYIHYPAYVSSIYMTIYDIQGCIRYLEKKRPTIGTLLALRFMYFVRLWVLRRKRPEIITVKIELLIAKVRRMPVETKAQLVAMKAAFDDVHEAINDEFNTRREGITIDGLDIKDHDVSKLKNGEVSGSEYKEGTWQVLRSANSGPVTYMGKNSLTDILDHCPELFAHKELLVFREFILEFPTAGTIMCFYIFIGHCGALGLTEDMFHGLSRYGLKKCSSKGNFPEVSMGSDLGDIDSADPLILDKPWPGPGKKPNPQGCQGLSGKDMAETIVGINNSARYHTAHEFVRRSIMDYIEKGGNFTANNILNCALWHSLADVLNLDPLACRICRSDERCLDCSRGILDHYGITE